MVREQLNAVGRQRNSPLSSTTEQKWTPMPEFTYVFVQTASHVVTVNADTYENGENAAYDELPVSLCHQCAHEFDMAGDWELDEEATETDAVLSDPDAMAAIGEAEAELGQG